MSETELLDMKDAPPAVDVERKKFSYTEKELWEKYLALTKELLKFINKGEITTFTRLVDQRQQLYYALREAEPHVYGNSPEGMALKEQIKPMDMQIMYKARTWLNKSRRQNMAVKSYDIGEFEQSGNIFNREY